VFLTREEAYAVYGLFYGGMILGGLGIVTIQIADRDGRSRKPGRVRDEATDDVNTAMTHLNSTSMRILLNVLAVFTGLLMIGWLTSASGTVE
jgi:hypothetical protein